jgi:hypothetical protein
MRPPESHGSPDERNVRTPATRRVWQKASRVYDFNRGCTRRICIQALHTKAKAYLLSAYLLSNEGHRVAVHRLVEFRRGNREIADVLAITEWTVETHVAHLLEKLDATRRTERSRPRCGEARPDYLGDQPATYREAQELGVGLEAEQPHHPILVECHGPRTQLERSRGLLHRPPLSDQRNTSR